MKTKLRTMSGTTLAEALVKYSGGTLEGWLKFLDDDRAGKGYFDVPFSVRKGEVQYDERDAFDFIVDCGQMGPLSRKLKGEGSVVGSTFECIANLALNRDNHDDIVIELSIPDQYVGNPYISADEARALSNRLWDFAEVRDETNKFLYGRKSGQFGEDDPEVSDHPGGISTGDPELDALLAELDGDGSDEKVVRPVLRVVKTGA
jgi:hypothetical protein